jgi:hypothetical protein
MLASYHMGTGLENKRGVLTLSNPRSAAFFVHDDGGVLQCPGEKLHHSLASIDISNASQVTPYHTKPHNTHHKGWYGTARDCQAQLNLLIVLQINF